MAVVRYSGLTGTRAWIGPSGGTLHALHHADLHAAFLCALQLNIVHEVADEENAAAARLQEILGIERVGDRLGIEAFALIADLDRQLGNIGARRLEFDEDVLGGVALVAVLDGVDDRFADGHADPVEGIVVEAHAAAPLLAHALHA